jgi:membrane-associated protease RseP (regulator of RpoE activity)
MTDLQTKPPAPAPASRAEQGEHPGNPIGLAALVGLVVLAGVSGGWPLLLMIGAIVVMVFLHELGHFLTAKWAGMKVTEFFIGFGPRIWSFRRGETEYGIKPLPLGAYVKIVGMHNLDEYDPADVERTYLSKPFWRRLSVAVAGSTMHFLLALVVLFVGFGLVGVPGERLVTDRDEYEALLDHSPWLVDEVSDDSGAARAGIEQDDRIISVDGVAVDEGFASFQDAVRARPDETVPVVVERDGQARTLEVHIGLREDDESQGFFGVGPFVEVPDEPLGVADGIGEAGSGFTEMVDETFSGLGQILSPSGLADLGRAAFTSEDSPAVGESGSGGSEGAEGEGQAVGIIGVTDRGAEILGAGEWGEFLVVFAFINVFIGVFNLLPMLPLDGGHVAIALYEKVRSMLRGGEPYHVDVVKLLPFTYAAFMLIVFIGISTIVLDTRSLVGG